MPKPTAVLEQINIVVKDIWVSSAFYRRLGVEISTEDTGTPFHVGCGLANDFALDLDSTDFAQVWNVAWAGRSDLAGKVVVGFAMETREAVDEKHNELIGAGHKSLAAPFDAFWGARYAIVEDPDGVAVGLMSPVDRARSFWPPKNWKG